MVSVLLFTKTFRKSRQPITWWIVLEHSQQVWQMCQMPNIWHICHTKHKKHQIPDVPNPITFTTCKQYRCKFATVWNRNGIILILFYSLFSLLSLHFHFILFSSLSPLFSLTGCLSSQPPIPSILSFPFNLRSV